MRFSISTGNGKYSQAKSMIFYNIYDYPYVATLQPAQTGITVMAGIYRQKNAIIPIGPLEQEQ